MKSPAIPRMDELLRLIAAIDARIDALEATKRFLMREIDTIKLVPEDPEVNK